MLIFKNEINKKKVKPTNKNIILLKRSIRFQKGKNKMDEFLTLYVAISNLGI